MLHGSWRTTVSGVLTLVFGLMALVGLAKDQFPAEWHPVLTLLGLIGAGGTTLATAAGLIVSRDNNVSSEQAGCKHAPTTTFTPPQGTTINTMEPGGAGRSGGGQ